VKIILENLIRVIIWTVFVACATTACWKANPVKAEPNPANAPDELIGRGGPHPAAVNDYHGSYDQIITGLEAELRNTKGAYARLERRMDKECDGLIAWFVGSRALLAREIITLKTNWVPGLVIGTNLVTWGWRATNTTVEIVRRGKTNTFDLGDQLEWPSAGPFPIKFEPLAVTVKSWQTVTNAGRRWHLPGGSSTNFNF